MVENEEKKGIFGKAVDAFSNRDEKEMISSLEAELAETKQEAEEAQKRVKTLVSQNVETRVDKNAANKALEEAEKKIADLEKKLKDMLAADRKGKIAQQGNKAKLMREKLEALKPAIITTHIVESNNQTLSHIALKYYKHATPPYWKYLLEHNKEVLKGSEKNVRMGMELVIPELPDELKD